MGALGCEGRENYKNMPIASPESPVCTDLPPGIKEPFQLPEVKGWTDLDVSFLPEELQPGSARSLDVVDPYIELETRQIIDRIINEEQLFSDECLEASRSGSWVRSPGLAYPVEGEADRLTSGHAPVMQRFFSDKSPTFLDWATKSVPSAFALAAISNPITGQPVIDKEGNRIGELDPDTARWFRVATDGVAIRTRAAALGLLVNEALRSDRTLSEGKWMSVACGTAIPTLQVARLAGIKPELTLVDGDMSVMNATTDIADALGIGNGFNKITGNVFDRDFMESLGGDAKIIDLMGIFEYIGPQLESLGIETKANEFMKWNYDLLVEGGRMVLGQMLTNRPRADFTLGTIGWPFIVTRHLEEIMRTAVEAGIDPKNTHVTIPNPGVYAVVAIDKV